MPTTIEASTFASSLGVNVHMNFSGTAYQNVTAVQNALGYVGINTMRDQGAQTNTTPYATLANKGFHFDFFAPGGQYQLDMNTLISRLHSFAVAHPGAITSLEGPNEVNNWPISYNGTTDLAAAKAFQQAFFNAASGDSALNPIPMINLSLAASKASTYTPLGDMSRAADMGNVHPYMSYGNQPNVQLSTLVSYAQAVTPGKPIAITESGYSTLASDTNLGVDEATQAKLTLNLVLDSAKMGIAKTFLYELADDQYSGGGAWNHLGLYRSDWSAKPAATALHNLMTTLNTDSGAVHTTAAPDYTVSGLTGYNASLTFHETNGSYDIVVWREPDIWDSTTHSQIKAAAQTATIQLTSTVAGYAVYDPLVGTSPIATGGATNKITLQVTDHPLVVELHGGGTAPPAPPPPSSDGSVITGTDSGETLRGTAGADTMSAKGGMDWLLGNGGNDKMDGGEGSDRFNGQAGDDTLTGGAGGDLFYFQHLSDAGVDRITDFDTNADTIFLDHVTFSKVGAVGGLSSDALWTGSAAHDSSDRIIYNSQTGDLMYDPDGTGSAQATVFAHLNPLLKIASNDFHIY